MAASDVNTSLVLRQIRICIFQEFKKTQPHVSGSESKHPRSRKKVHVTMAVICGQNPVEVRSPAPALRALHIHQLLHVKQPSSWDSLIQWSFLHCGTVQPGEKSICLRITLHIACGSSTLMQNGTFKLEVPQAQED